MKIKVFICVFWMLYFHLSSSLEVKWIECNSMYMEFPKIDSLYVSDMFSIDHRHNKGIRILKANTISIKMCMYRVRKSIGKKSLSFQTNEMDSFRKKYMICHIFVWERMFWICRKPYTYIHITTKNKCPIELHRILFHFLQLLYTTVFFS